MGLYDARNHLAILEVLPPGGHGPVTAKIQSSITGSLHVSLSNGFPALFEKRLGAYFPCLVSLLQNVDWMGLRMLLGVCAGHLATTVLKSWLGAWATSKRMHEPVIKTCILGCDQADDMRHYYQCARFWAAFGHGACELPLICRLALSAGAAKGLKFPVVAFLAYHELKHKYSQIVSSAYASTPFDNVLYLVKSIVDAHIRKVPLGVSSNGRE